jgi:hypothetical protein
LGFFFQNKSTNQTLKDQTCKSGFLRICFVLKYYRFVRTGRIFWKLAGFMIHDSNRAFFIAPDLRFQSLQNLWSQDSQDESTALRFPYKITATLRIIPIIIRQHLRMLESIYYCQSLLKVLLTNLMPRPAQLSTNDEFHL